MMMLYVSFSVQWRGKGVAKRREVAGSIPGKSLDIFRWPIFLSAFSSPEIRSASNRREYEEISLEVKCSRRGELTTLPS